MKCTCPKCQAKIELDLPEVTEAGTSAVCPACNVRFTVHKESFGSRALHKVGEISCAPCGNELGSETFCPSCGARFPDYLVATRGRKQVRRSSAKIKLKSSPFPESVAATTQLPTLEASMRPEAQKPRKTALPLSLPQSQIPKLLAALLVLAVLVGSGSYFYSKYQSMKSYKRNFVVATYCIQTGEDRILKENARIAADWKARIDAGQSFQPHASATLDRDLGIINRKIDIATKKLADAPEKFISCNDKLSKLQGVYKKMVVLINAPGNSLPAFTASNAKLEAEFKQAAKEFKAGLPPEIMDDLLQASKRYRSLGLLFANQ